MKMTLRDKLAMEKEHTKSKAAQKKIVNDHEKEFGAAYYLALKKMESGLKRVDKVKYEKPDKEKHNVGKNKMHEKKESKKEERLEHKKVPRGSAKKR